VYLREIRAEDAIEGGPHIERRRIDLLTLGPCLGQSWSSPIGPDGQCRNSGLQLTITVLDLGLVEVVEIE
jgi:hypothetical protein